MLKSQTLKYESQETTVSKAIKYVVNSNNVLWKEIKYLLLRRQSKDASKPYQICCLIKINFNYSNLFTYEWDYLIKSIRYE